MEEDGEGGGGSGVGTFTEVPSASPQLVKFLCGALQLGLDGRQAFNLLILYIS